LKTKEFKQLPYRSLRFLNHPPDYLIPGKNTHCMADSFGMTDWQGFREEEAASRERNLIQYRTYLIGSPLLPPTPPGPCHPDRQGGIPRGCLSVDYDVYIKLCHYSIAGVIGSGARDLMGPFEIKMKSGIENQGI
jgi:hypothetical protein